MSLVIADCVKETTTTTGTGTISLGGTVTGFVTFVTGVGNGNTCPYKVDDGNGNWEETWGQVASGTPATITRGTLINSSTGSRINFAAGTKTVAIVPMAELLLWPAASAALVETDIASATTTDLGTVQTFRARITGATTITSFGTQPNTMRFVRFAASLTLTHNATTLILLGAANHQTQADDVGLYISDGSGNWREIFYHSQATNFVSGSASGGSLSTATTGNVTTISLPAGDWDVEGAVAFVPTAATVTSYSAGASSVNGTFPALSLGGTSSVSCSLSGTLGNNLVTPRYRFNLTATTTIYLLAQATFSAGSMGVNGYISARRVTQ